MAVSRPCVGSVKHICSDIIGFACGEMLTDAPVALPDEEQHLYCTEPATVIMAMEQQQCRAEVINQSQLTG